MLRCRILSPGVITNPTSALSLPTTTVSQLLRPFPHLPGLPSPRSRTDAARYDSLQINVGKRMSHGLNLGAAYTSSKFLESTSWLNPNDAKPREGDLGFDRPQRLVIYGIYDLPVGRGKRLLGQSHRIVDYILGGWQMSTGLAPFSLRRRCRSRTPSALGGRTTIRKRISEWFDVTQFVPREPFTLARTSSRIADLRGDGMKKWDVTLSEESSRSPSTSNSDSGPNSTTPGIPRCSATRTPLSLIPASAELPVRSPAAGRATFS